MTGAAPWPDALVMTGLGLWMAHSLALLSWPEAQRAALAARIGRRVLLASAYSLMLSGALLDLLA